MYPRGVCWALVAATAVAVLAVPPHEQHLDDRSYERLLDERWTAIAASLPFEQGEALVGLDWGSNRGYFSMRLARHYRNSLVISVEGSRVSAHAHRHTLRGERGLANLVAYQEATLPLIDQLSRSMFVVDVQFCLSFFHHLPVVTKDLFDGYLGKLLSLSRVTILEVPSPDEDRAPVPPAGYVYYRSEWYNGRSEVEAVQDAARVAGLDVKVDVLLASEAFGGAFRKLMLVRVVRGSREVGLHPPVVSEGPQGDGMPRGMLEFGYEDETRLDGNDVAVGCLPVTAVAHLNILEDSRLREHLKVACAGVHHGEDRDCSQFGVCGDFAVRRLSHLAALHVEQGNHVVNTTSWLGRWARDATPKAAARSNARQGTENNQAPASTRQHPSEMNRQYSTGGSCGDSFSKCLAICSDPSPVGIRVWSFGDPLTHMQTECSRRCLTCHHPEL